MIEVKGLTKIFNSGNKRVSALDNVDIHIQKGDFALIKGPSGCGKSTLLFILGGLLHPSSGAVRISDVDIYALTEKKRLQFRSQEIGFIFQSYYLIPYLTVMENIMILNKVQGLKVTIEEVTRLAEQLNFDHRLNHKPSEMSIGEKQRASLVRALAIKPKIILADEPTGNLDPENADVVLKHLELFHREGGTVVMVSHGSDADNYASSNIYMDKGGIVEQPS